MLHHVRNPVHGGSGTVWDDSGRKSLLCEQAADIELDEMVNAIQCAEFDCIRYGGSNRTIQIRLVQVTAGSISDALPEDLHEVSAGLERQALRRRQTTANNERVNQSWWRHLLRFFRRGA